MLWMIFVLTQFVLLISPLGLLSLVRSSNWFFAVISSIAGPAHGNALYISSSKGAVKIARPFGGTVSVESSVGLNERQVTKLRVFPNPTENTATLAFEGIQGTDVTIEMYNLLGELIISKNYTSQSNLDYYNLDVSSFNNGMYNLVFKVGESTTTKKLKILK